MNIVLRSLLRKSTGDVVSRDVAVSGSLLRIGRGADSEVFLSDPRVLLQHAVLGERDGGFYLEAVGNSRLVIRGEPVSSGNVKIGDSIGIGPYELKVEAPLTGSDADFVLTVELVQALDDVKESITEKSTLSLEQMGLRAKPWSIAIGLLVAVLFIGLPVIEHFVGESQRVAMEVEKPRTVKEIRDGLREQSNILPVSMRQFWQAGHLSSSHKIFGLDCSACHQEPFQSVARETCTSCHADAHDHVDRTKFPDATISDEACTSCHKEHEGSEGLVLASEAFCTDCHAKIDTVTNGVSELDNISSFDDHKAFWYESEDAQGPANLKFSHKQHLDKEGMRVPTGVKGERRVLGCDSCHVSDPSGTVMQKPEFEVVCAECHSLAFDANMPERTIPHEEADVVRQYIRDAYSAVALRGGFKPSEGESVPTVVRRIPGSELTNQVQKREALAWADSKANEVIGGHFGKKRCAECHAIVEDKTDPLNWNIGAIEQIEEHLKKGHFNHEPHGAVSCSECHAAEQSEKADELLLPSIDTCKDCHGSEGAGNLVTTTCTNCHGFHTKKTTEVKQ